jgi:ABC-type transport system involved in cytochrome bd biosynthesis fused ATPase/permease subunit
VVVASHDEHVLNRVSQIVRLQDGQRVKTPEQS